MIITIDGPSGTGKTTVAKKTAEKLGIPYFDTGAMYRSVAWALLKEGISLNDKQGIDSLLSTFTYDIRLQNGEKRYFVGSTDVTQEIRTQEVTSIVSEVAAMPIVREALWKIQRSYGNAHSAVFEGRDMGSVVFPNAEVKIFLDAKPKVRAERRLKEMRDKLPKEAEKFDQKGMAKELKRRDTFDKKRTLAPLKRPKGAYKIDTSNRTIDQVVDEILEYHQKEVKKLLPAWLRSRKMKLLYRFVLFIAWLFFKVFYRHKVYGLEHYVKRAAIIAPNHTSYLDPPATSISWPEEVHFLAREGLFRNPIFGRFIRALNSHPVRGDASDVSVFKTILKILGEGKQLILFPEGERTDGELGEIKPGIGMLVMRSKAAIIPAYLHGMHEIWSRDRKFPKPFGKTVCVFGSPILSETFAHLDKKEAQVAISKHLEESLHALKKWYESGAEGIPP